MNVKVKRFIDCYVPTEACNFKCTYCYVGQRNGFTGKVIPIEKTADEIRRALSRKRFGGTMFLNFYAGGETLLNQEILAIVHALLQEGHIVQIVTNGSIKERFIKIAEWERDLLQHLLIKFSFHYLELKRLNMLDQWFENINLVRNAGVSISLEITPCDEMIPYIEEIKEISLKKAGALPHINVAGNDQTEESRILSSLDKEEYKEIWGQFHSPMFSLKMNLLSQKRNEYCYGGEWTFYLNIKTGELKQCYKGDVIDNIYTNIEKPIHFLPIGKKCRESCCFNGHVWLTLGAIPNMNLPTYAEMRNRILLDGSEWLSKDVKEAFSGKLEDVNIVYENIDAVAKIFMIGDSILRGYIDKVKQEVGKSYYIYDTGEIAKTSFNIRRYLHEWAFDMKIGSNIDVVFFNAGLWDVLRLNGDEPMVVLDEYNDNLKKIIWQMKYLFPNAKIVFATTTPVIKEEWYHKAYRFGRLNQDIEDYNKNAVKIMEDEQVYICDLNKIAKRFVPNDYVDSTHFTEEAYHKLGVYVSDFIANILHENDRENKAICELNLKDESYTKNKIGKHRVIVYGAGTYGKMCVSKLDDMNIRPEFILDKDTALQQTKYQNIPIIAPVEYVTQNVQEGDLIIIGIHNMGIWNNVIALFTSCKNVDICSYKILDGIS